MQDETKYWDDPESPWYRAMRRRSRQWLLLTGFVILMAVITGLLMIWTMRGLSSVGGFFSGKFNYLYGLPVLFMIFPAWTMLRQRRHHLHVFDLIIKHNGIICPVCMGGMKTGDDDECECPTCMRTATKETLTEYCVNYGIDHRAAHYWLREFKTQGKGVFAEFRIAFWKRYGESPVFAALSTFLFLTLGVSPIWIIFSFNSSSGFLISMLDSVFSIGNAVLIFTGAMLFSAGFQRKGKTKHCKVCDYQLAPTGMNPDRCPECGVDWNQAGAIATGSRIGTKGHVVAGTIFMALWLMLFFSSLSSSSQWKYNLLPTNSLISEAVNVWFKDDVWIELGTRPLSTEQHDTLARGLLDMRLRKDATTPAGGAWLDAQINANTLTPEVIERYYRESFELGLTGPLQARKGQTIQCDLVVNTRSIHTLAGLNSCVFLGDYFVNGKRIANSRASLATHLVIIADEEWADVQLNPDRTGDIRITRDVWIVIDTTNFYGPIIWQEDDTPLIPPGVTWTRKIALQHDIEVIE